MQTRANTVGYDNADRQLATGATSNYAFAREDRPAQGMINDDEPAAAKTSAAKSNHTLTRDAPTESTQSVAARRKGSREKRRLNEKTGSAIHENAEKLSSPTAAAHFRDKQEHQNRTAAAAATAASVSSSEKSSPISSVRANGHKQRQLKSLGKLRESRTSDSDGQSINNDASSVERKYKEGSNSSATATTVSSGSSSSANANGSTKRSGSNEAKAAGKQKTKCSENNSSHGTPARQSRSSMNICQSGEETWQSLSSLNQIGKGLMHGKLSNSWQHYEKRTLLILC